MLHRRPPDDPVEWLNRARASLVTACHLVPGMYLEDRCYDAQQAAEKALKGLLLHTRGDFPRTHRLGTLLELLAAEGVDMPSHIGRVARLTEYATARYPTPAEAVTDAQYRVLVEIARSAVAWVARLLGQATATEAAMSDGA